MVKSCKRLPDLGGFMLTVGLSIHWGVQIFSLNFLDNVFMQIENLYLTYIYNLPCTWEGK